MQWILSAHLFLLEKRLIRISGITRSAGRKAHLLVNVPPKVTNKMNIKATRVDNHRSWTIRLLHTTTQAIMDFSLASCILESYTFLSWQAKSISFFRNSIRRYRNTQINNSSKRLTPLIVTI